EHYSKIDNLRKKLKPVKDIQILLLALVTLLLLFSAVWVALHLARGITVPIQALAEATSRVARGDFSHPIDVVAEDELAALVQSFNQMANQLSRNRELLEDAAEDLSRTNLALLDRRGYIETVLESLSTGVISMGEGMGIATINLAAVKILGFQERPAPGTPIKELVAGHRGDELAALCRRARRAGRANTEIEFVRSDGSSIQTATTSIALQTTEGDPNGWVIVIEDLTDLIQAERAAAWSEVARRMAHEIKNPLTPIQLSAERIMRNYNRAGDGENGKFGEIVKDGTSTIVREVGTLQRMVEEFSRFARLPEARPVEGSLNSVIEDAVRLYSDRLEGIRLEVSLDDRMPLIYLDPEQIKRVMVNLIENAVEALGGDALREVGGNGAKEHGSHPQRLMEIVSTYVKGSDTARIVVSDTGHGIKGVDRDKLFQPKFSTRSRGTGLGLAIVSHIISDHKGRIWVEENKPRGARFIIELPAG
ncbi:MAG TPA: ATP-binding protein, partial [Blastocatellia bacterium]|nr:ATP-binding protein [Blastocatellia bacterium]